MWRKSIFQMAKRWIAQIRAALYCRFEEQASFAPKPISWAGKFSFSTKFFVWIFPLANLSDSVDNLHFLCFPSLIERNFDNVYVISQPGYVWTAQWPTSLLALDWKLVNKMAIFHSIEGPRLRCYTKFEYSSFFQAHDFPLRSKQYSALPLTWTAYKIE